MRLFISCLLFLACTVSQANAGVLNMFYESDAVIMHRRDLRHDRHTQRHNRKVHKHQNHHAAQMGMYNMTAPFQPVPVRSGTQYMQDVSPMEQWQYMNYPAGSYNQSTTIRRTVHYGGAGASSSCGCGTAGCQSTGNGSCSCK